MKKLFLIVFVLMAGSVFAQDTLRFYLGDTILVTGTRIPSKTKDATRSVSVTSQADIKLQAVRDMDDILNYSPVDVQERGMGNVQADLSIRGSKSGQLLVLWDGLNMNDPQTGHFFANIPAPFNAVDHSEIITGGNSSMYGAQAFGGVINFIPRKMQGTRYGFHSFRGSFASRRAGGYLNLSKGRFNFSNFFDFQNSDGHTYNTDFRVTNSFHMLEYKGAKSAHRFGVGHQQKDFGAQDFYAPYDSRERNESIFLYLKNKMNVANNLSVYLNGSWRKHTDKFVLFRTDPNFYINNHRTEKFMLDASFYYEVFSNLTLVTGASYGEDYIFSKGLRRGTISDSSGAVISTYPIEIWALGKHRRINKAAYAETRYRSSKILLNAGFRADYNTFYKSDYSPAFDAAWYFNRFFKVRGAYSHAFRAPDYTELFYISPSNIGNPNLHSESADNYELGADFSISLFTVNATAFLADELNVIDWIPEYDAGTGKTVFHAQNFNHIKNKGFELKGQYQGKTFSVNGFYQYLEIINARSDSKYIYNFSKNLLKVWGRYSLMDYASLGTAIRYTERMNGNVFTVVDSRLNLNYKNMKFTAELHNMFNRHYENIPGVDAPGRWFSLGMAYNK